MGNNGWYISNTTAWADCSDSVSGCTNERILNASGATTAATNSTYTEYRGVNANGVSSLAWKVKDNSGRVSTNECLQEIKIDKVKPTIKSEGNKASSWYSCTINGSFQLKITGVVGPSGAKISRYWENENSEGNWDISYSGINEGEKCSDVLADGQYCYTTQFFSAEHEQRNRIYKIESNANPSWSAETKEPIMIDNTSPTIDNFNCKLTINTNDNCNEHPGTYCCTFDVKDAYSGYFKGLFTWNGGSNDVTRSNDHTEHIGFSNKPINLWYKVCDKAGNCKDLGVGQTRSCGCP